MVAIALASEGRCEADVGSSVQRCQLGTSGELNGCYHDAGDDKPTARPAHKLCLAMVQWLQGSVALLPGGCPSF